MAAIRSRQVAAITGASAGVGRATALRFARGGYSVGLIARDRAALEEVAAEIAAAGGMAIAAPADVADADAVFAAAERIEAELGPIDVWINDAMATVFSPLRAITPDEYRRVTEVTYLGCVHGTMAALRRMTPRDRGSIVQIGSALAYRGIPLQSAYCGAKHAIRGFTDSLRSELLHDGSRLRIVEIDLPAVNTPQFDWGRTHMARRPRPMGRPVRPQAVAEAVYRAAHGRWGRYWLGGSTALTVIGSLVAPGFLDRYLVKAVEGQERAELVEPERRDNLDAPVEILHRTDGSFAREAKPEAALIPDEAARLAVVAAGAAVFFALGAAFGRRGARR